MNFILSYSRFCCLSIVAFLASCSQQEPPKELCAQFNSVIDRNIADVAVSNHEGTLVDKSVMHQSARAQDNQNRLSIVMINVQLQAQSRCAPRQKPIDPNQYEKNAAACHTAKILESNVVNYRKNPKEIIDAARKSADACDFSKWNP